MVCRFSVLSNRERPNSATIIHQSWATCMYMGNGGILGQHNVLSNKPVTGHLKQKQYSNTEQKVLPRLLSFVCGEVFGGQIDSHRCFRIGGAAVSILTFLYTNHKESTKSKKNHNSLAF